MTSQPGTDHTMDQLLQAALHLHQAGRLAEAKHLYQQALRLAPDNAEALYLLGTLDYQQGDHATAADLLSRAIHLDPDNACAHDNLGTVCQALGRLDDAAAHYRRAIALAPDAAGMHFNLGNVHGLRGEPEAAATCYRKALSLAPDYADAHIGLGNALRKLSRQDEAAACYREALRLNPNYAEACFNLGIALQELGRTDQAIPHYRKALALKPGYADAYRNLGIALSDQGSFAPALESFRNALRLRGDQEDRAAFARCIGNCNFTHEPAGIRPLLIQALSEPWGRPGDLASAGISLVKLDKTIRDAIKRAVSAWPARLPPRKLYGNSGLDVLAQDRLLHCLLENAPMNDRDMERFLTLCRHTLLDAALEETVPPGRGEPVSARPSNGKLDFYCALARQCFINEYVFASTAEEAGRAQSLRERLAAALDGDAPASLLWLAAVAAYFPLHSLPGAGKLLAQPWPEPVTRLLAQQVREPLAELELRGTIPALTPIEGEVSELVRQQYEESPYPRWTKIPSEQSADTPGSFLRKLFPLMPPPSGDSGKPEILVAGCGTGRHAIETARRFRDARVLAIDLSLSSLSYALRKTRELDIRNIEYAQADIMRLSPGRTFDVIESVGVLHHLADPMAGWRILVSLLRPGGFMRLGFYSELGRCSIVEAREFIAQRGYAPTVEDIRRCRQELMSEEHSKRFEKLFLFRDFYASSECRDLLFHVQEHRYSLPMIRHALDELGLEFLGFSLEQERIARQYRERFPDDVLQTDLGHWDFFEHEHPDAFAGMYQFWVRKR